MPVVLTEDTGSIGGVTAGPLSLSSPWVPATLGTHKTGLGADLNQPSQGLQMGKPGSHLQHLPLGKEDNGQMVPSHSQSAASDPPIPHPPKHIPEPKAERNMMAENLDSLRPKKMTHMKKMPRLGYN